MGSADIFFQYELPLCSVGDGVAPWARRFCCSCACSPFFDCSRCVLLFFDISCLAVSLGARCPDERGGRSGRTGPKTTRGRRLALGGRFWSAEKPLRELGGAPACARASATVGRWHLRDTGAPLSRVRRRRAAATRACEATGS